MVPEACVEAEVAMFTTESQTRLLKGRPDYVIDAIDDIDTKVHPSNIPDVSAADSLYSTTYSTVTCLLVKS